MPRILLSAQHQRSAKLPQILRGIHASTLRVVFHDNADTNDKEMGLVTYRVNKQYQ